VCVCVSLPSLSLTGPAWAQTWPFTVWRRCGGEWKRTRVYPRCHCLISKSIARQSSCPPLSLGSVRFGFNALVASSKSMTIFIPFPLLWTGFPLTSDYVGSTEECALKQNLNVLLTTNVRQHGALSLPLSLCLLATTNRRANNYDSSTSLWSPMFALVPCVCECGCVFVSLAVHAVFTWKRAHCVIVLP